jgi:deoxyribonuclease V
LPNLIPIDYLIYKGTISFQYVPGLLSFHEAPILLEIFKLIRQKPDLIFIDSHRIAHPRRLGLASNIGLYFNPPINGCNKSRLYGKFDNPSENKGAYSDLINTSGEPIGAVLRTKDYFKTNFGSTGH